MDTRSDEELAMISKEMKRLVAELVRRIERILKGQQVSMNENAGD